MAAKEKIILQTDVEFLGLAGEMVDVARGYARNYLLPKGLAVPATQANETALASMMATVVERKMKIEERAREKAAELEALLLVIPAKVGEEGQLFGSVTNIDLAASLAEAGQEIDRKKIELKPPIKLMGSYEAPVKLEAGVVATVKFKVVDETDPDREPPGKAKPVEEAPADEPADETVEEAAEATEAPADNEDNE